MASNQQVFITLNSDLENKQMSITGGTPSEVYTQANLLFLEFLSYDCEDAVASLSAIIFTDAQILSKPMRNDMLVTAKRPNGVRAAVS